MSHPRISLEQWRALVAVVDAGGYAQAAEQLHKTQSSVSYAIQRIEAQLGLALFAREGRRSALTDSGRLLYRRGRQLVQEAERIERGAAGIAAGWEPEIALAVEILFPTWLLLQCLDRFAEERPETRIELYESVLGGSEELLETGQVDLAISSRIPPGCVGDPLTAERLLAVAAPSHPLHRLERELTFEDLRGHRHLIIRDSGTRRNVSGAWEVTEQRWTVSHKATSIRALRMGLGFAWMAEGMIRDELDAGQLVPLPLTHGGERWGTLYLVYPDPETAGPGARRLGELLQAAAATGTP
ncbi:MAG: LysR family transcriptional regulator [Halofilum sp. (in: g-proteobacteria)]